MRLIKMLGLAAVAAVAAMAFVGATSASATICNTHTALTCGSAAISVSMNNSGQGVGTLLTDLVNVLCLTISTSASALPGSFPSSIHSVTISFLNCGTKSSHSNCVVIVIELPLWINVKLGLDTGTITGTNGLTLVNCDNIDIFGIDIHCIYDSTGLEFVVGAQHLTANDTAINFVEGGGLCPEESFLDGLLKTTANRYVLA